MGETWRQVPNNRREYGPAAGKYIHPDAWDALDTLPKMKPVADKTVAAIMGYIKSMRVSLGGPVTYTNMFMSNFKYGMHAGGVDPTRPVQAAVNLKWALKAMGEHRKNPLAETEMVQFIKDARRLGVDGTGFVGAEIVDRDRRALDRFIEGMNKEDAKIKDIGDFMGETGRQLRKVNAFGGHIVDGIDRIHKLASFKILTKKFQAVGTAAEMPREAAMQAAAMRIAENYPMPDRVSPLQEKLRTSGIGIVTPFATFTTEEMRIKALNAMPSILARDPAKPLRMGKYIAFLAACGAAAKYAANQNGISDETIDYAKALRTKGDQERDPFPVVFPARVGKDESQIALIDASGWADDLQWLSGNPETSLWLRPITNVLPRMVNGGGASTPLTDVTKALGGAVTDYSKGKQLPGREGLLSAAQYAWEQGLGPSAIPKTYNAIRNTGLFGAPAGKQPTKEPMPLGAGVARMFGAPRTEPVTVTGPSPSLNARMIADKAALDDIINQMRRVSKLPEDEALDLLHEVSQQIENLPPGETKKQMKDKLKHESKQLIEKRKEFNDARRAARESK